MKKLLSLILSFVLTISILNFGNYNVFASTYSGTCGNNAIWTLNSVTGELTISGSGYMYDEQIPAKTKATVRTITIGDSISSVGDGAFAFYSDVTSVKIGKSVTYIGNTAFCYCVRLTSVEIPGNVASIGSQAFEGCRELCTVVMNEGVRELANNVFSGCTKLTTMKIPNSIENFITTGLSDTTLYKSVENWDIHDDYKVLYVDNCAICSVTTPNATSIDLRVKEGTRIVGDIAFYDANITSIIIPSSVKKILHSSIAGCDKLKVIKIYSINCTFSEYAIYSCDDVDVYGYINSTTYRYAYENGFNFICLEHNYKNYIEKATTTQNGKVKRICSGCGDAKSTLTIYYPKTIKLSSTSYVYNGKVKKPSVTIKDSNGKTISSSNYTVTYASGRKNVGKYSVKITFKGNYSGSKTLYFTIKPKTTSISSLSSPKSAQVKVKWKKVSNIDGYEIQVSKTINFTSQTKKYTSKASSTNKTVKFVKKSKSYVRIRTYKKVNGKKYYSSWSKVKSIKTK